MITTATKISKAQNIMEDRNMVAMAMPAYMDLRGFAGLEELTEALKNPTEMEMFFKFTTAAVVSLVCDKADEFEKGYENGWK